MGRQVTVPLVVGEDEEDVWFVLSDSANVCDESVNTDHANCFLSLGKHAD